jgi:hypothetical protein
MQTGPNPTWLRSGVGRRAAGDCALKASGSLEDADVPRHATSRSHRSAVAARWADQWQEFPALRREDSRSKFEARRPPRHGQPREPQGMAVRQALRGAAPALRQALFPAEIFARPYPHRTGPRDAPASLAEGSRTGLRYRLPGHRPRASIMRRKYDTRSFGDRTQTR